MVAIEPGGGDAGAVEGLGVVLSTHSLTKRYGPVAAVDRLELAVRGGEVYGLLGRNGAGKTTTIRMLLGLVRPTAGDVRILGTPITVGESAVFGHVGYLVETPTAYGNLTVRENLEIQRRLTGSPAGAVPAVIDRLQLGRYADRRAGHLSLGNKQRLSLARALLHDPKILILDEPANALDPAGIVEVRRLLRRLTEEEGVSVFMSSHILSEVAHLADRIGIMHDGRLLEELDRAALDARARPYLEVRTRDLRRALHLLRAGGFTDVEPLQHCLRVFYAHEAAPEIARTLVQGGVGIDALVPGAEDLESYFLGATGGDS